MTLDAALIRGTHVFIIGTVGRNEWTLSPFMAKASPVSIWTQDIVSRAALRVTTSFWIALAPLKVPLAVVTRVRLLARTLLGVPIAESKIITDLALCAVRTISAAWPTLVEHDAHRK